MNVTIGTLLWSTAYLNSLCYYLHSLSKLYSVF